MIAYIKGALAYTEPEEGVAVLESGGIGYRILLSGRDLDLLPPVGEELRLYTHLQVREDAFVLFGFFTKEDRKLFQQLLGVNGIGPKAALGVLTALSADDLRFAVLADDAKAIAKAPGIGIKTAQKLILELKDKLSLEEAFEARLENQQTKAAAGAASDLSEARNEAVEALTALGYSASESLKAVRKVEAADGMSVEDILKAALKYISF
ncbi:Holliday junction branch migration protein RuvA [Laedolimicola ammoniilytica]|uniref:Holliday junction branch migration complex subunit RuvA n=1 Tax=Laedolimicola ammoniilytica TaxID=2981771 RepID=A0ABT2RUG0_9FIRM|nr:Holliday junction branch migration protein RuvA [Laedolimicola ammoniilytica]MCU6695958.1 Holliday junction branch migration protein RuvA [Laedolimicola ammoniilytica]SCH33284.1 Holliday junction ATP-dependent DNA helicase RuvA [uncultured Clostridium sp.]